MPAIYYGQSVYQYFSKVDGTKYDTIDEVREYDRRKALSIVIETDTEAFRSAMRDDRRPDLVKALRYLADCIEEVADAPKPEPEKS